MALTEGEQLVEQQHTHEEVVVVIVTTAVVPHGATLTAHRQHYLAEGNPKVETPITKRLPIIKHQFGSASSL
jgi:hypothetical protein